MIERDPWSSPRRCPPRCLPASERTARSMLDEHRLWTRTLAARHPPHRTSSRCGSAYHAGVAGRICAGKAWPASRWRWMWRQRVPLPGPHCWTPNTLAHCHQPVGRDRRHPGRPARGQDARRARSAVHRQRGGLLHRPRERRRAVHLGRAGNLRGHHQGLLHPAGHAATSWPSSIAQTLAAS